MARNMFAIIGDRFSYFVSERPRGSNVVRAGLPLPKGHGVHIRLKTMARYIGIGFGRYPFDGIIDACHGWQPGKRQERADYPMLSVGEDMIYF